MANGDGRFIGAQLTDERGERGHRDGVTSSSPNFGLTGTAVRETFEAPSLLDGAMVTSRGVATSTGTATTMGEGATIALATLSVILASM